MFFKRSRAILKTNDPVHMHSILKTGALKIISRIKSVKDTDQMLIFSDPRGGGTWLTEMLGTLSKTAIIWEPLNIRYVSLFRKLGFGWRQYIPEEADWDQARDVFKKVFRGKVINEWTCMKTSIGTYWEAEKFIIKFCRGHMLLPWLVNQFVFRYSPVYLVRHPMAVVASQMKHRGWDFEFSTYRAPESPFNQVYKENEKYLQTLKSKEERLTAIWSMSNAMLLNHPKKDRWLTLYYEDLALDPDAEMSRIFKLWQINKPAGIKKIYMEPSSTANAMIDFDNMAQHLGSWQKFLTSGMVRKMSDVLDHFQITAYDADHVLPVRK